MNKEEIIARPYEEYYEMIKDMAKDNMIQGLYDLSKECIEKQNYINQLEQANKSLRGNIKAISKTSNNRHLEIKRLLKRIEKLEFYKTILEANQYCPYDKDCGKLYDCTKEEYQQMCEANVDLIAKINQLETNRDEAIELVNKIKPIYKSYIWYDNLSKILERGKE